MGFPSLRRGKKNGVDVFAKNILAGTSNDPLYDEQFKALRAKFEYKVDNLQLKLVAVTSAIAGEGKSISCANLAINLAAHQRKKVLLLDMDIRKSDISRMLGIQQIPGLTEYLLGTAPMKDIVRNSITPGLQVIPSGDTVDRPGDLLAGEKFRVFLNIIRDQYDVILLDTPPVLSVADTLNLRDQVDGFVFLFRLAFTPHELLAQAVEDVGEKKVIGVILNGVEPKRQEYYERYYGKYYRKSYEEKET